MPKRRLKSPSNLQALIIILFLGIAIGVGTLMFLRNNFDIRQRAVGYCRENSAVCSIASECCSGNCQNFICVAANSTATAPQQNQSGTVGQMKIIHTQQANNEVAANPLKPGESTTIVSKRLYSDLSVANNVNTKSPQLTNEVSKPQSLALSQNSTVKVKDPNDSVTQSIVEQVDLSVAALAQTQLLVGSAFQFSLDIVPVTETTGESVRTKMDGHGNATISVYTSSVGSTGKSKAEIEREVVGAVMGMVAATNALKTETRVASNACNGKSTCHAFEAYVNAVESTGVGKIDDRAVLRGNSTSNAPHEIALTRALSESAAQFVLAPQQNSTQVNSVMKSLFQADLTAQVDPNSQTVSSISVSKASVNSTTKSQTGGL